MDKKEAEAEALKKAKETQNTAGKSSGMSGRDLVRSFTWPTCPYLRDMLTTLATSSNTTQNGSKTKTRVTPRTTGISRSTDARKKQRIWLRRNSGSLT